MALFLTRVVLVLGPAPDGWPGAILAWLRDVVRFLAAHTGLPVLLVAAVVLAVSYRILKRSLRFLVEVFVLAALLLVATQLGFIRW